jgi:hypothetical protein
VVPVKCNDAICSGQHVAVAPQLSPFQTVAHGKHERRTRIDAIDMKISWIVLVDLYGGVRTGGNILERQLTQHLNESRNTRLAKKVGVDGHVIVAVSSIDPNANGLLPLARADLASLGDSEVEEYVVQCDSQALSIECHESFIIHAMLSKFLMTTR